MNFSLKLEPSSHLGLIGRFLAILGLLGGLLASLAVMANDLYYLSQYGLTPSVALLLGAFLLALLPGAWGLVGVISLLPLTAGIPGLLKALLGISVIAMPNPGLDLVAGLFLGYWVQGAWFGIVKFNQSTQRPASFASYCPWPVGLVLLMITTSTVLAIARNVYLSATTTSIKGFLFNLVHFRPIDWRADYLPLGNWVAYAIAGALIMMVIERLKKIPREQKSQWIFRSLMLGLAVSAITGLIQAATGFGLPQAQLEFRKDAFGFAAIGMQPDLHAYAAHMLLGVIGLWGYFLVCKNRVEKVFIITVFILCGAGLVASKSRASLGIALFALLILVFISLYQHSKKYFWMAISIFTALMVGLVLMAKSGGSMALSGLGWIGELAVQMQQRRLDNLSDLGGMMGSRFEIWSAVANMFSTYPIMGVGEGEFYRLSSVISFARSEFLQLNHGENAHNYFLQVLAENGLVGIAVFAIAFIAPYRACSEKRLALPAAIGLLSLFLGNIFAHSFLVRENLLLGAALLGLLYALSSNNPKVAIDAGVIKSKGIHFLLGGGIVILLIAMLFEVYFSFGRLPFKAGADCFVKELPLYQDGWTSGAWGERLPKGAKEVELSLMPHRQHLDKHPFTVRADLLSWEAGKGNVPIDSASYQWKADEVASVKLVLPKAYYDSPNLITVNLVGSSCYTPRNLGINTDGRRLGVEIKSLAFR